MGNQQSLFDTLIHGNNHSDYSNPHSNLNSHRKKNYSKYSYSSTTSSFQSAFHFTTSNSSRNHNNNNNPKDCCALWKAIKSILGIWTTGNSEIDEIIKESQRTASKHRKPWKWIPFDKFEQIKPLAKGGYGHVYSAWCTDRDVWGRVALKSLEYSENISKEYLQQLRAHASFEHSGGLIRIYGMTKNPETNNYMLVMKHAKCNLRQYINKHFSSLTLSSKIELLVPIANGLRKIHQAGLTHGNFHPGNILQTMVNNANPTNSTKVYTTPQTWSFISDLGLCGPASNEPRKILSEKNDFVDEPETMKDESDILDEYFSSYLSPSRQVSLERSKVYGVLPYIAPEVLRGQKYTQAADVYAFGFVMYEVFMGHPPYHDVPHDLKLAQNICKGHRPEILSSEIPNRVVKLISSCWDSRPDDRPSAKELHNTIRGWYWRLDPEMKSLMRADDEARGGIPIKDNGDGDNNSGISTPQTPETPNSLYFPNTPFNTSLNSTIRHSYSSTNNHHSHSDSMSSTISSYGGKYEVHPEAVYTSRLLEFDNLPQTSSWYY